MTTLQEYLDWKYPTREDKERVEMISIKIINEEREREREREQIRWRRIRSKRIQEFECGGY